MNTAMESGFSLYLRLGYVASAFFTVVLINFRTIMQSKDVDDKNVSITVKTTVTYTSFQPQMTENSKIVKSNGKNPLPKNHYGLIHFLGSYIYLMNFP